MLYAIFVAIFNTAFFPRLAQENDILTINPAYIFWQRSFYQIRETVDNEHQTYLKTGHSSASAKLSTQRGKERRSIKPVIIMTYYDKYSTQTLQCCL